MKNTKAQDILAKRKADAAKATLPPLAEKSAKLLKVNETLARRKAKAAKVGATEREKKKTHDPALAADVDKRLALKKRPLERAERAKQVRLRRRGPTRTRPPEKGRGLTQSRRLMRTLISCRRLKSIPAVTILRRGQRRD
jgi:hypothetical protein